MRLRLVGELFDAFHGAQVSYCHWKSNEHLDAAVAGKTDLDLLVDERAGARCERILVALGFKRFVAPAWARYEGIEDYLGVDEDSGALIHLHWHYELSIGKKGTKAYRVPWHQYVLDRRVLDQRWDCYVAEPSVETVLLLVRAALKDSGDGRMDEDMVREYEWLRARTTADRVADVARDLLGEASAAAARATFEGTAGSNGLRELVTAADPPLSSYLGASQARTAVRRAARKGATQVARVMDRVFSIPVSRRRVSPERGTIVAIIGPDGAGKSTVVQDVVDWLSWKIDVEPVYMGTAKTLTRGLRMVPMSPGSGGGGGPVAAKPGATSAAPRLTARSVGRMGWAVAVALDKKRALRRAAVARRRGLVVICDRYPQAQVMNFNDGPLLSRWLGKGSSPARAVARWEWDVYDRALAPDLVVRLNVSSDIAASRRPGDVKEEVVRTKSEALASLQFPAQTRVIDVDADRDLDDVLRDVRLAVWSAIPSGFAHSR